MRYILFILVLISAIHVSAQSPAVSKLYAEGARQANARQFTPALESYRRALLLAENEYVSKGFRARVHYNIGVCHFQMNDLDPAASQFKQAILLDSTYVRAHYALGMTHTRKRDWKAAAVSFKSVIERDPSNGEAWFDLAFASIGLGDLTTAEKAFRRSITFASVDSALSHNNIGVILAMNGDLAAAEASFVNALAMSDGRLLEAKRNLDFCRAQRSGRELIAITKLEYAARPAA